MRPTNIRFFSPTTTHIDNDFERLMNWCRKGDIDALKELAESDEAAKHLNTRNEKNYTLAHCAAVNNANEIIELIAQSHAHLFDEKSSLGLKPIDFTVINHIPGLFNLIFDHTPSYKTNPDELRRDAQRLLHHSSRQFPEDHPFRQHIAETFDQRLQTLHQTKRQRSHRVKTH